MIRVAQGLNACGDVTPPSPQGQATTGRRRGAPPRAKNGAFRKRNGTEPGREAVSPVCASPPSRGEGLQGDCGSPMGNGIDKGHPTGQTRFSGLWTRVFSGEPQRRISEIRHKPAAIILLNEKSIINLPPVSADVRKMIDVQTGCMFLDGSRSHISVPGGGHLPFRC